MGDLPDDASIISAPNLPNRQLELFPVIQNMPRNARDKENGTTLETPADVMGVPTLRDIFGLPRDNAQTNAMSGDTSITNLMPGETLPGDLGWAKILTSDPGGIGSTATNSQTQPASMFSGLSGFFDSAPAESSLHRKKMEVSDFGSSPFDQAAASQPPAWDSYGQPSVPDASAYSASVAAPPPVFNSGPGFNSQSPFTLPKSSSEPAMPQLPSLPVLPGQYNAPSQPVVPSWAPKPAPWLTPGPQLGVMEQRKF